MTQPSLFGDSQCIEYEPAFQCKKCNKISPVNWWSGTECMFTLQDDDDDVTCQRCHHIYSSRSLVTEFVIESGKLRELMEVQS